MLGSRPITGAGMFLSKYTPPCVGYAAADLVAGLIAWSRPTIYWNVHANLRQVVGPQMDEQVLHRIVRRAFRAAARNDYELWHLVGRGREAVRESVQVPNEVWEHIEQARQGGRGVILVGIHTGNFNLLLLALAAHGVAFQVLGLAAPPGGGFDLMDRMRARAGLHLTSIEVSALREAISRLREGGIVVTGVDRPVDDAGEWVEFFGRPAPLPAGHVRLALKTGAVILVGAPYHSQEKGHTIRLSPPLEMIRTGDPDEDLRVNMRRVTVQLEQFIRSWPDQWAMFVQVWPKEHGASSG